MQAFAGQYWDENRPAELAPSGSLSSAEKENFEPPNMRIGGPAFSYVQSFASVNRTVKFSPKQQHGKSPEKKPALSTTYISAGERGLKPPFATVPRGVGNRWYAPCYQHHFPI